MIAEFVLEQFSEIARLVRDPQDLNLILESAKENDIGFRIMEHHIFGSDVTATVTNFGRFTNLLK
jgi:hypothetical protein